MVATIDPLVFNELRREVRVLRKDVEDYGKAVVALNEHVVDGTQQLAGRIEGFHVLLKTSVESLNRRADSASDGIHGLSETVADQASTVRAMGEILERNTRSVVALSNELSEAREEHKSLVDDVEKVGGDVGEVNTHIVKVKKQVKEHDEKLTTIADKLKASAPWVAGTIVMLEMILRYILKS